MTINKSFQNLSLVFAAMLLFALILAPSVRAADLDMGDYGGYDYYPDYSYDYYPDYSYDYYPDSSYDYYPDYSYDYYPDYQYDYYPDYSYEDYYQENNPSYSSPSYSSPSYPGPSSVSSALSQPSFQPISSALSPYIPPQVYPFIPPMIPPAPAPSNTNVNTNTNTCTGGSCNTTPVYTYVDNTCSNPGSCSTTYDDHSVISFDDHSIFNAPTDDHSVFNAPTTVTITNPASVQQQPTIIYQQPPQPAPQPYVAYQPVYQPTPSYNPPPAPRPVSMQQQPYVTLSQIPYTGLDLGPIGTALYWSFLVLWTLFMAYLIVYKRVQAKLVNGLNKFFFAGPKQAEPRRGNGEAKSVKETFANGSMQGIDPFIASQINR